MTEDRNPTQSPPYRAVFVEGSTLRHVLAMTASGSVGLVAIFVVDLLSLLYISRLGDPALTAGVGFATQVLFVAMAFNIGLAIAISAIVARELGAGDRPRAQRLAASVLCHVAFTALLVSAPLFFYRADILDLIGARGPAHAAASTFLAITLPTNVLVALGMSLQWLLRAVGDARRSMYVTLSGAIVAAILDPILIFGLHLGVPGAAISTALSRIVFVGVGLWGAVHVHGIVGRPRRRDIVADFAPLFAIAGPAVLTNLATPAGNIYAMRALAHFGEPTVAAIAIIERIVPVAFGVLFALTGSIGPIVGQNFGAGRYDRIRRTILDCFGVSAVYVFVVWLALWLAGPHIADMFDAKGATRDLVTFFCTFGSAGWLFLGALFVSNAAFNNLGYPMLATLFNWGRATLGTIPFVLLGAQYAGPQGGYVGLMTGSAIFGAGAVAICFVIVARLARRNARV